jgi:HAD superfamily hydrolase (TIGR01549 family)
MALLVFDIDGVIRDRSRLAYRAVKKAFLETEYRFEYSREALWRLSGVWYGPLEGYVSVLLNAGSESRLMNVIKRPDGYRRVKMLSKTHPRSGIIAERIREYLSLPDFRRYVRLYPGVKRSLEYLAETHTLTALTNSTRESVEQDIPFLDLFECVLTGDEVPRKPDPRGILKIRNMFSHSSCYVVGDTIYDLMAAKNAGVHSVAVTYGQGLLQHLLQYTPHCVVHSAEKLGEVL